MKFLKNNNTNGKFHRKGFSINFYLTLIFGLWFTACTDFVEVDTPKNLLTSETVFNDPATIESAFANIYFNMREQGMTSGNFGVSTLLGIYSDELDYYGSITDYSQLYFHNVLPGNNTILDWWSQAYNNIFAANDIIQGIENSETLTAQDKDHFKGQALFLRAYTHSLLVGLFGNIPYISTTDYIQNNTVERLPAEKVYDNILNDLSIAINLLEDTGDHSSEKILPGLSAAKALLARMYLYTQNWQQAETLATNLIDTYTLESDLNKVFLKESSETIWQFKPGVTPRNTQEGNQLIIQSIPGQTYSLTESLNSAFENGDLRSINWVNTVSNADNTITLPYAYKYKADLSETESLEYSIIFRLAEQFLIRAEARARLGNISGAQQDLNVIRNRAGLGNTTASSQSALVDAVLHERRVELFTEQGHRWFDLKRTNNASSVLNTIKQNWQETNILLPLPETELSTNPNLLPQNPGY